MPAQKTDWKKVRAAMQDEKESSSDMMQDEPEFGGMYADKGKLMLEKGARQSLRNDLGSKATSMETLMRMWQENQEARLRNRKNKKHMPLKGLFGGGE
jgi:hypothetical protein